MEAVLLRRSGAWDTPRRDSFGDVFQGFGSDVPSPASLMQSGAVGTNSGLPEPESWGSWPCGMVSMLAYVGTACRYNGPSGHPEPKNVSEASAPSSAVQQELFRSVVDEAGAGLHGRAAWHRCRLRPWQRRMCPGRA